MMAAVLSIVAQFWRPIAAFLAGIAAYAKGRADAKAKADLREAQAYRKTIKDVKDAPVHVDAADARKRMSERDPRKP